MKRSTILYSLLFSGLGVFSFLLLVNYTDLPNNVTNPVHWVGACAFFILGFNILGYFTIRISSWINNQYALNMRSRGKIVAAYLLVMFLYLLLNYALLVIAKMLVGASAPFVFPNGGMRILLVVWLVELVILGLLLANRSIQSTLELQQQTAELQKENNVARYTALQNQLNPHFLFNSLNTLIAEIEYNPSNAVSFTKSLSNVYRYVLQCQDKTLVTLSEELGFMDSYLFLHKVRMGDCIACNSDIPSDCRESLLPPLTLQLLVENVIKHNSIAMNRPMEINISVVENRLVVSNQIRPKKSESVSGVGLQNLSKRCKLMLGEEIAVEEKAGVFTVKVPLLYE
ncbi:sensor histidine kinase [Bacteroides sp.]